MGCLLKVALNLRENIYRLLKIPVFSAAIQSRFCWRQRKYLVWRFYPYDSKGLFRHKKPCENSCDGNFSYFAFAGSAVCSRVSICVGLCSVHLTKVGLWEGERIFRSSSAWSGDNCPLKCNFGFVIENASSSTRCCFAGKMSLSVRLHVVTETAVATRKFFTLCLHTTWSRQIYVLVNRHMGKPQWTEVSGIVAFAVGLLRKQMMQCASANRKIQNQSVAQSAGRKAD